MATQVVPIENIDKFGFVADSPAIALPPGAFSDVLNVRFDNGAIRKVKGYVEIFNALNLTNIIKIAYWPNPNKPVWVVVNRQGAVGSQKDHIYGVSLDANGAVTSTNLSANTSTGYAISDNWQATLFNGGYSIILNPGNGTPQHSTDTQGSSSLPSFADLPNWAGYTANSTNVNEVYCGIIIPLGNLLLAGDLAEYDSNGNIIRDLRGVVRSSSVAAPGTIPQNWNPFATGAGTADEIIIADTGQIKAMKPLQGKVMVYTSNSISQLSVTSVGLSEIKVTDQYGAINQDSVYEYDGRHIVLGSNDIYSFEGHPASIKSIADGRVRRFYYDDVHGSSTTLTRIVRNLTYDELWICYRNNNNTTETLNMALTWNYRQNVWSKRSLPNIKDIVVGSITGGGVDTQQYTFTVSGNTGTTTAGTPEVQQIPVSGATLGGGIQEVQSATYSGTRSNVVGDQNEIYTIDLGTINTGSWSPIPSGSNFVNNASYVNNKAVGAPGFGTTAHNFGGVTGLSITAPAKSRYIFYTQIRGNGGSPSVGTVNVNNTSFGYTWHNRHFGGSQNDWGTSLVRETDEQIQYCKTSGVYTGQLDWRWTAGQSGWTQLPFYFKIKVIGHHRTSASGTVLTGTHYYTLTITRNDLSNGQAKASRHSGDPGGPNNTSVGSGSPVVESNIARLYDMQNCTVEFYFNAYLPGTSSAAFGFTWSGNPAGYYVANNSAGNITLEGQTFSPGQTGYITVSGNIDMASNPPTVFTVDLDANNSGTFAGNIQGVYSANRNSTTAAEELKNAINAKGYTGVTATRSGNVVTVDTGQNSNLSGSYSITLGTGGSGGGYNLTSQNGFNNPTFSTTYTVTAPDGTVVNTFTSSVSDVNQSDVSTVLSAIQSAVQGYTNISTNIENSTVTTTSPNIVVTNGRARTVAGVWSVTVNNNNVGVNEAGNIAVNTFSETTAGVNGQSITGNITLGSQTYPYTAFNALTTTSTNNQMVQYIAEALDAALSEWTVTNSGANIVFTDKTSRDITNSFAVTMTSSDSSTPTTGSTTVTTQGVDSTRVGTVTSVITPTAGPTITLVSNLSNVNQNQCATELANDLNARPEFVASASGNVVSVEYTQFGDAAPSLDVSFDVGTVLSGNAAIEPTNTFSFLVNETRDIERPWPITFINENFSYLVGVTDTRFYAFDIGNESGATDGVTVSGVTKANPGVVTTSSAHGLEDSQQVTFTSIGGMTELNGNTYYAKVLTATTYELYTDYALANAVDTTNFTTFTSGGTSVAISGTVDSYIERKNIHVSPTKDIENYTGFYLDTEGEDGTFDIRVQMTNAAGRVSDLSPTSNSAETFNFTFGGDAAEHDVDTRLAGRIANYRIQNDSKKPWSIAGIGFEYDKGGRR